MEEVKVKKILLGYDYPGVRDLRFNTKKEIMFSKEELQEFKKCKEKLIDDNYEFIENLPLKSFDSKHVFFVKGKYLLTALEMYLKTLVDDYYENKELFLVERLYDKILTSRLFSEIEGTLNIENVPTTRKRIREVCEKGDLKDKNDIIIRNMHNAMLYIMRENPPFNKENLKKLYDMLSCDCLDEEDSLKGNYYRDDAVFVGGDEGAPSDKIPELMDSLFEFVNGNYLKKELQYLLPHICHYYILYVHPYFDYNGRTARMVSFWIGWITDLYSAPIFISEAINENRKQYYQAISDSREMDNDLTYFLGYIFETSAKYSLIYKNLEEIEKRLAKDGDFLTSGETVYLKKILVHNSEGYFNAAQFIKYINSNMSKQGALKVLNQLTEYGILQSGENKKNEKIFKINQDFLTYKVNTD